MTTGELRVSKEAPRSGAGRTAQRAVPTNSEFGIRNFSGLPLLLRRGQVVECGLTEDEVRGLAERGANGRPALRSVPLGVKRLYLKCDLAELLRLPMDWREAEDWGALLTVGDLYRAGLCKRSVRTLVEAGRLLVLQGHGPARFYRSQVLALVGYGGSAR